MLLFIIIVYFSKTLKILNLAIIVGVLTISILLAIPRFYDVMLKITHSRLTN